MEILEFNVSNHNIKFVNETWETYNAWGHKTELFIDNSNYGANKIRYYNRTWEMYRYQSVMSGCVWSLIENIEYNKIKEFKEKNNILRLTEKRKSNFLEYLRNNDEKLKLLYKIQNKIATKNFLDE